MNVRIYQKPTFPSGVNVYPDYNLNILRSFKTFFITCLNFENDLSSFHFLKLSNHLYIQTSIYVFAMEKCFSLRFFQFLCGIITGKIGVFA